MVFLMLHVLIVMHPRLWNGQSVVTWPAGQGIEEAIREHGESVDIMFKLYRLMCRFAYHLCLKPGPCLVSCWYLACCEFLNGAAYLTAIHFVCALR